MTKPCDGKGSNVCVAEGCYAEKCREQIPPRDWIQWFSRLSYKTGWEFDVEYAIDYNEYRVYIGFRAPSTREPDKGKLIRIGRTFFLPEFSKMSEDQRRDLARGMISALEMHEMDEHLLFDGEMHFDPHKLDPIANGRGTL